MITQSDLKSQFNYNPITGHFTRLSTGKRAGSKVIKKKDKVYYRSITISGSKYPEHKLAHLYMTGELPTMQIDHEDGLGDNNCWDNLREVTNQINNQNRSRPKSNTSGIMGVSWAVKTSGWKSHISVDSKYKHLYYGKDFFEACCRRLSAELELGYHTNHGRV